MEPDRVHDFILFSNRVQCVNVNDTRGDTVNARKPARKKAVEEQLLADALQAFEETVTTPATLLPTEPNDDVHADAEIRLGQDEPLVVEVKRTLTPATLGHALAQLRRLKRPALLVTRYVTPTLAEQLKELDVPFLDTAGNAYLRTSKMLVYITGRKPRQPTAAERPARAFRATGLRVLFAILCRAELVAAPYRTIAEEANVALGTVGWVLYDLRRLGYVRETKARGRRVENKPKLIDAWVEAYPQQLRPRLKIRRFRVADPDWWKTTDLAEFEVWLGQEPAAAVLTRHLRPELITIYGDQRFPALARKIHPIKDNHGNLEVLQKFWDFKTQRHVEEYPLVPPLLIYADLVATADARNLETAELIRERFLV